MNDQENQPAAVAEVRRWLEQVVIGLGLCPFAAAPTRMGAVAFEVCDAIDDQEIIGFVDEAIARLLSSPEGELETSLLILTKGLADFSDYNQFLSVIDTLISLGGHTGVIQVASFHPNYQFEGCEPADVTNLTNCAPYPIFHLIREESLERVLAATANPEQIPERNMALMQTLSDAQIRQLFPYWCAK